MGTLFDIPSKRYRKLARARIAKTWDESKHPRGAGGRFAVVAGLASLGAKWMARLARSDRRAGTRGEVFAGRALAREALGPVRAKTLKPGGVVERDATRHFRASLGKPPIRGDFNELDNVLRSIRQRNIRRTGSETVRPLYTSRGLGKPRKRARR